MLPELEVDILTMTIAAAVDLAADVEVRAGYTALLVGLDRAQELQDEERWEAGVGRSLMLGAETVLPSVGVKLG